MSLKIATWNVNSIRQRVENLARFVDEAEPDLICLQETKVRDEDFPLEAVRSLGYPHCLIQGQKSYNGVAILSRRAFAERETRSWCAHDDRRHAAVRLADGLEVHNFYVPSGGSVPDRRQNDKFDHKLRFLSEMADWAKETAIWDRPLMMLGDLNVAPLEADVWNHKRLLRSVGHSPIESQHMADLLAAGRFLDAERRFVPPPKPLYTWWGYRYPQAFEKDYGWRLDHVWVTPPLAPALKQLRIWQRARAWPQPSDHVPVVVELG